jgi:hypothetical protein
MGVNQLVIVDEKAADEGVHKLDLLLGLIVIAEEVLVFKDHEVLLDRVPAELEKDLTREVVFLLQGLVSPTTFVLILVRRGLDSWALFLFFFFFPGVFLHRLQLVACIF